VSFSRGNGNSVKRFMGRRGATFSREEMIVTYPGTGRRQRAGDDSVFTSRDYTPMKFQPRF